MFNTLIIAVVFRFAGDEYLVNAFGPRQGFQLIYKRIDLIFVILYLCKHADVDCCHNAVLIVTMLLRL